MSSNFLFFIKQVITTRSSSFVLFTTGSYYDKMVKEIVARSRNSRKRRSTTDTGTSNGHERSHPAPGITVGSHLNGPPNQPPAVSIAHRINATREHISNYLGNIENATNNDGTINNQRGESEGITNNTKSNHNDGRQDQFKGSGDSMRVPLNRKVNSSSASSQQQQPPSTDQEGYDAERQDSPSHNTLSNMHQNGGQSGRQEQAGDYHAPISNRTDSHHRTDQHQVGEQQTKSDQTGGNQEQYWKPLMTSSHDSI